MDTATVLMSKCLLTFLDCFILETINSLLKLAINRSNDDDTYWTFFSAHEFHVIIGPASVKH